MAILILNPPSLAHLAGETEELGAIELYASDDVSDCYPEDGFGLWITTFIEFMEELVQEHCHMDRFGFTDNQVLNDDVYEQIPDPALRMLLIEFTNEAYEEWKDQDIYIPDYERICADCRSYCEDCESAYEHTYGEYEGPLAEDVEEDEYEREPDISEEEREERVARNKVRAAERLRRERAQEEAEGEIVDSEWVCDSDCDGFRDHAYEAYRDSYNGITAALKKRWQEFMTRKGIRQFPPLIVALASRR